VEATLRDPRPEKVAVVDEVQQRLSSSSAAILTEYRGLPVKDLEVLRRALRTAGGEYKIYKNTLVRRAIQAGGFEAIEPLLVGPTAIAFVDGDVVAVAKVLRDFARTNPAFVVKGGLVGRDLLDASRAAALADLPSREELLAQIAGAFAAPLQRFAGLLQAVPQKFAYALKALIESQGGAPVAEVAPTSDSEPVSAAPVAEEESADTADAPEADAPAAAADAVPATDDAAATDDAVAAEEDVAESAVAETGEAALAEEEAEVPEGEPSEPAADATAADDSDA
jgi:large subunit ribosomal protein L10